MAFKKAAPQQARLKVSIYGPPGSGKTFTALLMAEGLAAIRKQRIAYIDTEHGTDFYAMDSRITGVPRKVHPEAFDFDAEYTRSLAKATEEIEKAIRTNSHGIFIVDSISHIWDAAMEAYEGRKTSRDGIPIHAWHGIKKPYKALVSMLIGCQQDVFILGRQKNLFGKDDDGEMTQMGVAMRAEGETAYEPHICLRMESEQHPTDSTKSRIKMFAEKDRTGILQGQVIVNPGFSSIAPILPLLGAVQAPTEDADERAAIDAEALERLQEEKERSKEAKSSQLYTDFAARLHAVTNPVEFGAVAGDMKKARRYLSDNHEAALKELFNAARDRVMPPAA